MLDRPERGGITLSPGLDGGKLSLNGFLAYRRIKILGAFSQTLQEVVGCCLAVARLCKEQIMLWMLIGGTCLAKCVLNSVDIHDAIAACRAGAGENDLAHQTRLLLRDDLRDETAEREAQQIDFAKTESVDECDGIL